MRLRKLLHQRLHRGLFLGHDVFDLRTLSIGQIKVVCEEAHHPPAEAELASRVDAFHGLRNRDRSRPYEKHCQRDN